MPRTRMFDHEEAARLYATGEVTQAQLAERYGVRQTAISQMLARRDPKKRERMVRYSRAWQREHKRAPCKGGCGALVWTHVRGRSGLCPACMGATKARGVRETELLCHRCEEWKPDTAFPHENRSKVRRGRHKLCRTCQTIARQDYRERHKIPCVRCGKPCLPDSERCRKERHNATGLCLACYRDDLRSGLVLGQFGLARKKVAA